MLKQAAAALCFLLAACATTQPVTDITGRWVVVSVDGARTLEGRSPTLNVEATSGTINGGVACNAYSGELSWRDGKAVFSDVIQTLAGCRIPGLDMQRYYAESHAFSEILSASPLTASVTESGELLLRGRGGRTIRLRRA